MDTDNPPMATQAQPTDEETVQAVLTLLKRLAPRETPQSNENHEKPDVWLKPRAAAKYAAVSPDTLFRWISSGLLPAGRVGQVIRVRQADVDRLLTGGSADAGAVAERAEQKQEGEAVSEASRTILSSLRGSRTKRRR